ncbi:unnamed protein product [Commensalibacter communis]|uniref:Phage protein Gp138 N-terminal domain-containing protein n=1 Tax=Commensalibacter communis TaxID=2972786 RepID=A0A9W4TPD0_9PROT|nr:hypothetical protein [Commensalibacter communis]CAI3958274.1 unnamed protein product [Commensalibacter communis]CAI3959899.1 unnamed protein product [Commensalibacter communis]
MYENPLKAPLFKSLIDIAQNTVNSDNDLQGKIWPATIETYDGFMAIVNIEISSVNNYPQIEVPVLRSEYIRLPIQKGCRGFLIPLAVNIDHIIGMGLTAPTDTAGFNLGNMAFLPIASQLDPKTDKDILVIYGEDQGVKIQSKDGKTFVYIKKNSIEIDGDVTLKKNITINGDVDIKGTLTVGNIEFKSHQHENGNQGQPTGGVIG